MLITEILDKNSKSLSCSFKNVGQRSEIFSCKVQDKVFRLADPVEFVITAQLCPCNGKAAIDNKYINERE